jgi:hypothetical protein
MVDAASVVAAAHRPRLGVGKGDLQPGRLAARAGIGRVVLPAAEVVAVVVIVVSQPEEPHQPHDEGAYVEYA